MVVSYKILHYHSQTLLHSLVRSFSNAYKTGKLHINMQRLPLFSLNNNLLLVFIRHFLLPANNQTFESWPGLHSHTHTHTLRSKCCLIRFLPLAAPSWADTSFFPGRWLPVWRLENTMRRVADLILLLLPPRSPVPWHHLFKELNNYNKTKIPEHARHWK